MKPLRCKRKFCNTARTWLLPAFVLASLALPVSAGVLLRLGYDNIPGYNVSDLTGNPAFPGSPTGSEVLTAGAIIPMNVGNDYGSYVRGFIEAPQTGHYTFWIAAVDSGQLWLSPTEDPAGKTLIAQNIPTGWQGPNDWFLTASQQSAPVSLVRGQKYYFEMLHKEDNGGTQDSCSIAWSLPDGTFQGPISSTNLWPFPVDLNDPSYPPLSKAPQVLLTYGSASVDGLSASTTAIDGGTADLTVTIEASQPATVQWYKNNVAIVGAVLQSYHIDKVAQALDGAVFTVKIQNSLGEASASTTLSVQTDPAPPTLVDVLSLGNAAGDVAVVFSKPVDPVAAIAIANYAFSPAVAIVGARMGATPDTVLLQTAGLAVGTAYSLTANNIKDRASTPNTIAANSSLPVEQYLAAWYRLDETGGTVAADSSGNGLNGTMVSDVLPGYAGKVLRTLKFAGVKGGYVALPAGFADFTTNGMTVSLWVYPTSEGGPANWNRFIDFANGAANDNILFARTGGDNDVTFEVYRGGTTGGKVSTPLGTLLMNQWQHWAATMDIGGNVVIYRNGVPVATGQTGVPNVVVRANNYLGLSNWGGDDHYAGNMDDVRIYNRVLAPAAVMALAAGGGADDQDSSVAIVTVAATTPTTALKNTAPGVFTITRAGPTNNALTVQYTLDGTATNGIAYTTLPTSAVIPAGAYSVQVLVRPIDYSFQQLAQTVMLTLAGNASYAIGAADAATVTIQNNDVKPGAFLATADNPVGSTPTAINVYFAAPVAAPSATTPANYTLINAPGLSVTSATLDSHNLRVVLGVSGSVSAGAEIRVTGVLDPGGNTSSNQVPVRLGVTPVNIVANLYHGTTATRSVAYGYVTDGVVNNSNNNGTGFDTYVQKGLSHFVGLLYGYSQDFQVIKVDLGRQFGDGGNWATQPYVYLLKKPADTASNRPELDAHWVQVPAILMSGSTFQTGGDANPSPSTPVTFDLSGLPADQRTAYGWAVGGALGNGGNQFISVSELRAYGAAGNNLAVAFVQQPTNVTISAGQRAKFTAAAESTAPLTYQWYRNGSPILDATTSAYAFGPALLSDNGAQFYAQVTVGSLGTTNSQIATLTVNPRSNQPVLAATYDPANLLVEVWFNGSVDSATSQYPGNYVLSDSSVTIATATAEAQGCGVNLSLSGAITAANPTVTISGVRDLEGNSLQPVTVNLLPLVTGATNVVANAYQQGRAAALTRSTDGVVQNDANVTTWTTYGSAAGTTDFVGLGYPEPMVFGVVRVDLGWQFGDGGDWAFQPQVFILKHPVDTNQKWPETDPADWVAVPATLLSDNVFDLTPDAPANTVPLPNSPIAFDLSHLPLAQRTGWGFAIGGAQGNGPAPQFVSIAEVRGFGVPAGALPPVAGAPQILIDVTPQTVAVPAGAAFTLTVPLVTGGQPLQYQWQFDEANLSDNGRITGSQSSTLSVTGATPSDTGRYRLIVSNGLGAATSSVAQVIAAPSVSFNGNGFGWMVNTITTNVPISNNVLTLTDGGLSEGRTAFLTWPVYFGAFTASFTFQDIGGGGADGAAFVLQNSPMGPLAIGGAGGGLGYSGITPSAALELNVYGPNTVGYALRANGQTGPPYTNTLPVNFANGNPIGVTVNYDGATLFLTLTDAVAKTSFSTNIAADLVSIVGTNTAYVGFTGASGGVASLIQISNFSFANRAALSVQPGASGTALLIWPGFATGYILQQSTDLKNWSNSGVSGSLVNGQYQAQVPTSSGRLFYRLLHQ